MNKPELIAAIEALGWYDLKSSYEKASAKHPNHAGGWMVWHEPGPGEVPILTLFLADIQNPALLAKHA